MKEHLLLTWKLHGFLHSHNVTKPVLGKKLKHLNKRQRTSVCLSIARVFPTPFEGLHAVAA